MTDPRVRALALARGAAPKAAAPDPALGDALPDFVIDGAAAIYTEARRDWSSARSALRRGSRSSKLNSRRRAQGDLIAALIRRERVLTAMLSVLDVAPKPRVLARAAAVLELGLPADRVTQFDATELLDPVHLITGWALAANPTATEALATAASVSDAFAAQLLDEPAAASLLAALDRRAPLCLRALGDRDALVAELAAEGIEAAASPRAPHAVRLAGHPDVGGLAALKEGRAIVQDEGSQLVAAAVGAQPGETVVDACAGAGGKTVSLAAHMEGKGRLLACDIRRDALKRGADRVRQAGFDNVQPVVIDGPDLPPLLQNLQADRVLVDAPCTGTGALRRQPWNRWLVTGPRLEQLRLEQATILRRFADVVRPGGTLVYATCSVLPAENRGIVDAFLADRPDFEFGSVERLAPQGVLSTRPDTDGCDGFFAAVLRRAPGGSA